MKKLFKKKRRRRKQAEDKDQMICQPKMRNNCNKKQKIQTLQDPWDSVKNLYCEWWHPGMTELIFMNHLKDI